MIKEGWEEGGGCMEYGWMETAQSLQRARELCSWEARYGSYRSGENSTTWHSALG